MKNVECKGLKGREQIIFDLYQRYVSGVAEKVTLLIGPSGCGKSYVIKNILKKLKDDKVPILTYINQGNELISLNKLENFNLTSLSFSLAYSNFSGSIGVNLSSNTPQYQYLKRILSSKKNILLCIDNFASSNSAIKNMVRIIIENYKSIKKDTKSSIYFLISDYPNNNIENELINFSPYIYRITLNLYDESDIITYLSQNHISTLMTEDFYEKVRKIQKICNGNLTLVDFLFVDIKIQGSEYFDTLERIVTYRLNELKVKAHDKNISEIELEDIVLSSALCLQNFTAYDIAQITSRNNNIVTNSLDIAHDGAFMDKYIDCSYSFLCPEIQSILREKSIHNHRERLLFCYQYYTLLEQDEYYYRGYYLTLYSNTVTSQAFAFLVLSYISAICLYDLDIIERINTLFDRFATNIQKDNYRIIQSFFEDLQQPNVSIEKLYNDYKEIVENEYELPLLGAISCLFFHYVYHNDLFNSTLLKKVLNVCVQYALNELTISPFNNPIGIKPTDETVIRLSIIYAILPYILDVENDYEKFDELYILSKKLSLNARSIKEKSFAQYIENIFNQKAFLFANQTQCGIYYKKAKLFFQKNKMWVDYCITLICEAGTNIVIQEYIEAIRLCKKALKIAKDEQILIPQLPKLRNNLLIAEFLNFESKTIDIELCKKKANEICNLLIDELTSETSETEFVIITNICSLSLYFDNDQQYLKYKEDLEHGLKCYDVSNVLDNDIDDFYRYYFAWFEIYRAIREKRWEDAKKKAHLIDGFVPALFKKQEQFWDKKNDALMMLINHKQSISAYSFCNSLVKTKRRENVLSRFFFRGLMLSDLQYTSLR